MERKLVPLSLFSFKLTKNLPEERTLINFNRILNCLLQINASSKAFNAPNCNEKRKHQTRGKNFFHPAQLRNRLNQRINISQPSVEPCVTTDPFSRKRERERNVSKIARSARKTRYKRVLSHVARNPCVPGEAITGRREKSPAAINQSH